MAIAAFEALVDQADDVVEQLGEAHDRLVARWAVLIAVRGNDQGGDVGGVFIATLGVGHPDLHKNTAVLLYTQVKG